MNNLEAKFINGKQVVDSRDVAVLVSRSHSELLKTIRQYIGYMTDEAEPNFRPGDNLSDKIAAGENPRGPSKFSSGDFFIESTYLDSNGQSRPCYLITKMGCEMIANKMIGKKGTLFTAAYVSAFNSMQAELSGTAPHKTISDISMGQLASLIRITRAVMLDMGSTPGEIGAMTKGLYDIMGIPLPISFVNRIPEQFSMFEAPSLPALPVKGGVQA